MERDLAHVFTSLENGRVPKTGRSIEPMALRRAGYWLELIAQLGGPRLILNRDALMHEAGRLHRRLFEFREPAQLLAADSRNGTTMDDLARKWGLTSGTDIRRFRQLALTGHV